jgi:S1-C subfamily serine protease
MDQVGGELENVDKKVAAANELSGGVVVKKIGSGLLKNTKMQDGFIITSVNGREVKNIEELKNVLVASKGGTVRLEGIYPGYEGSYAYPLNLREE